MSIKTRRPDLDGLRGIAVLAVLLFHAFPQYFPGGYVGVDIFFVLSGYFIFGTFFRDGEAPMSAVFRFYRNRFFRIMPGTVVLCFLVYLLGKLLLFPEEIVDLSQSVTAALTLTANTWASKKLNYFDLQTPLKPLVHLWSLSIELQFYCIFPFFGLAVWRLRKKTYFPLILGIFTAGAAGLIFANRLSFGDSFYFSSLPRVWEFLIGMVAHSIKANQINSKKLVNLLSLFAFSSILLSVFVLNSESHVPGMAALLPVLSTAFFCVQNENYISEKILNRKVLTFIGLISFSLYLIHQPVFAFSRIINAAELPVMFAGLLCFAVIFLSYFYHKYIETLLLGRKPASNRILASLNVLIVMSFALAHYSEKLENASPFFESEGAKQALKYRYDNNPRGPLCRTSDLVAPDNACVYHPEQIEKILLWGDSHSDQLATPFADEMAKLGYSTLQFSIEGCPPIINAVATKARRKCKENFEIILNYLKSTPEIKKIFLHAYWHGYFNDGFSATTDTNSLPENFLKTIQLMTSLGRKVYIIGPIPMMPKDPPSYIARLSRFFSVPIPKPGLSIEDYKVQLNGLDTYSKSHPLIYLDPSSALFDSGKKRFSSGNDNCIFYRDDNHLSQCGAVIVSSKIAVSFKKTLE